MCPRTAAIKVYRLLIHAKGCALTVLPVSDDFRTARQSAFEYLKKLESLGRQAPPTQASSSTGTSQTALVAEMDRQLIDTLSKLTDILRRNLRVRYELNILDILKASVIPASILVGLMCIDY